MSEASAEEKINKIRALMASIEQSIKECRQILGGKGVE